VNSVSICIPAYEMNGKAKEYLGQLLNSISIQRGISYHVFISDSSIQNDDVKQVSKSYDFVTIFDNNGNEKTASSNMNNAILKSTGNIIKIMFADDFFVDDYSLFDSTKPIFDGHLWSVTACCHTRDGKELFRPFFPRYHDDIYLGSNTMSSPSTISMRRDNETLFDENINYLLDVEWYKRMCIKHGKPHINNRINVVNRIHKDSLTSSLHEGGIEKVMEKEVAYVKNKIEELAKKDRLFG